jgi:hypothetical protein
MACIASAPCGLARLPQAPALMMAKVAGREAQLQAAAVANRLNFCSSIFLCMMHSFSSYGANCWKIDSRFFLTFSMQIHKLQSSHMMQFFLHKLQSLEGFVADFWVFNAN